MKEHTTPLIMIAAFILCAATAVVTGYIYIIDRSLISAIVVVANIAICLILYGSYVEEKRWSKNT